MPYSHKSGDFPWEKKIERIEDLWGGFPGIKSWADSNLNTSQVINEEQKQNDEIHNRKVENKPNKEGKFNLVTEDFKGFRLNKSDTGNNANIEQCEYSDAVEASFTNKNSLHVIGANDKSFFLQANKNLIQENNGI